MSDYHDHEHGRSAVAERPAPVPDVPDDAASQALSEALKSSFAIVRWLMIGLVVVFLFSGFFQVGTQEKAIILRFGKPAGGADAALLGPGPHWAFPYPIDEVVKIPIGQAQTVASSVGWYHTTAAQEAAGTEQPPGPSLNPALDGYVLTADANIIHVRGTLLYRIAEPALRYEFDFAKASNVVQNIFNNAINYAAATYLVDDILKGDVAGFREKVRVRVEQLAAERGLGITIDQVSLEAKPPRQLTTAFAAVLEADVRRSKILNDARSYANQSLSKARGDAAGLVNAGETERNRMVEFVAADAKRFNDALPGYKANPELFMQRLQLETMQRVLTNAQNKWLITDQPGGKPMELRIQLNNEQQKIKSIEQQTDDHH
jgi:modulator of FtsH protease HflK